MNAFVCGDIMAAHATADRAKADRIVIFRCAINYSIRSCRLFSRAANSIMADDQAQWAQKGVRQRRAL